jgi:4a-hydroxytetrahydrobiopterin dehydratase
MDDLAGRQCVPCTSATGALSPQELEEGLSKLRSWSLSPDGSSIYRTYEFQDYYHTMAFVNAVAWVAHCADHHPDLSVSYKTCRVRYTTHSIGGLSENDLICAARVDRLLERRELLENERPSA